MISPDIENDILINFTGGINNLDTPLSLFVKNTGDVVNLVNADLSDLSKIKLKYLLKNLNSSVEASSVHSIFRGNGILLIGTGVYLKYWNSTKSSFDNIFTDLSGADICFTKVGNWVYLANGTDKRAVYLKDYTGCDWGCDIPTVAPTVADSGVAGNPDGTYSCYYRYRITLNDDSIILTELSPVGSVIVATNKISWSALVHSSFSGAKSVQIDLFRTKTGFAGTYLVATIDEGTTTYTDDVSDTDLQTYTAFAEDGYLPPPASILNICYYETADRLFGSVDGNAYWSEAGAYHTFLYDSTAGEYTNVNSVYLGDDSITAFMPLDEQLYIGSKTTWRRLRGSDPDEWAWESTTAIKGPLSWKSVVRTQWGLIYPANDKFIHLFNGIISKRVLTHFKLDATPDSDTHMVYDGRFLRMYYDHDTYPEVIFDMLDYPESKGRITRGSQTATASFYDNDYDKLYIGTSDGYVKTDNDTDAEVTFTLQTPEFPSSQLKYFDDFKTLYIQANTQGDDIYIYVYQDNVLKRTIIRSTSGLDTIPIPTGPGVFKKIYFILAITTKKDIEFQEPWFLSKETNAQ